MKKIKYCFWLISFLLILGAAIFWFFILPRIETKRFQDILDEYGKVRFLKSQWTVRENEIPYRTGKIMVIEPPHRAKTDSGVFKRDLPAQIDPVWFKLSRRLRAVVPDQVDTLIIVNYDVIPRAYQKKDGDAMRSVVQKIAHLKVYDWKHQFLIGTWSLESYPIPDGALKTSQLDAINKSALSFSVLEFVENMPFKTLKG